MPRRDGDCVLSVTVSEEDRTALTTAAKRLRLSRAGFFRKVVNDYIMDHNLNIQPLEPRPRGRPRKDGMP